PNSTLIPYTTPFRSLSIGYTSNNLNGLSLPVNVKVLSDILRPVYFSMIAVAASKLRCKMLSSSGKSTRKSSFNCSSVAIHKDNRSEEHTSELQSREN